MECKLVIIEDSPVDALIIKKTFQTIHADLEIIHFDNGEEAITHLVEHSNENIFVLLDMNMPVLGGLDFIKKKAGITEISQIPLVTLSSHYAPGEKETASEFGVSLFMEKPMLKPSAEMVLNEIQAC